MNGSAPDTEHCRTVQLRRYVVPAGQAITFARWWEARIPPLRERHGFRIDFALVNEGADEFIWTVSFPGDEPTFSAAEAAYMADPERVTVMAEAPPLRAQHISFVAQVR